MTTISSSVSNYDLIKEDALINIERLFKKWRLDYVWISPSELDFRNPLRSDKNFGAVRFNTEKGFGADFAGVAFGEADYKSLGSGLSRDDFDLPSNQSIRYGFDIIGLCQRLFECHSYKIAANLLKQHLSELDREEKIVRADITSSILRKERQYDEVRRKIQYANNLVKYTQDYVGTVGEKYLHARGLTGLPHEPSMRFHQRVMCKETGTSLPCLIFKIQPEPNGAIRGAHRIYLKEDGSGKADISNQKMALGEAKHNAIWFGTPGPTLYIAEGPENALTLRLGGAQFVACSIFAANMPLVEIPPCVETLFICPDRDKAGFKAASATLKKNKPFRVCKIKLPKKILMKNGKFADLNDILMMSNQ